ncbi:MAG TPA: hypothetical protein DFS52_25335 [Myxococcales bacterium]|jgi:hypothetical protein|nr:hypothetical protein [Myxococcales bacterium]
MGFSIGGFKLPEIKLPKLNLPKLDISKGVEILKGVVGDMFAPAKDGQSLFNKELHYKVGPFDIRLKNPVEALAEKLLGKVGEKLQGLGLDTSVIARMLTGKREVPGIGELDMPKLPERIEEYVPEVGGAPKAVAPAEVEDIEEAGDVDDAGDVDYEPEIGGGTSTSSATAVSGGDSLGAAISSLGNRANAMNANVSDMINSWDGKDQKKMFQIQEAMQARSAMFELMSNLMRMEHETRKNIIQNIR